MFNNKKKNKKNIKFNKHKNSKHFNAYQSLLV